MSSTSRYATRSHEAVTPGHGLARRVRAATRSAVLSGLGALSVPRRGAFVRCIYGHYVFDDQVARFRKVLTEIRRLGEFVNTDACVQMLRGEVPIDGRYFHLSFDDGLRNLYTNAAPVLVDLNIPAIVFVPTAYVGVGWEAARRYSLETVRLVGVVELLRWEDLRELQSCGIEVGSHTRTHARLAALPSDVERDAEIGGSKRDIETHLGTRCDYMAWPFGTSDDFDAAARDATRRAGYRACFGAFRGGAYPGSLADPFRVPRHHIEVQWPLSHIRYFVNGGRE
jgi:peptidoglycan/xylan/chitin deacetylase (PgdA/CDA1 family)